MLVKPRPKSCASQALSQILIPKFQRTKKHILNYKDRAIRWTSANNIQEIACGFCAKVRLTSKGLQKIARIWITRIKKLSFKGLSADHQRTLRGSQKDFPRITRGLSTDHQRTLRGSRKDSPRITKGLSADRKRILRGRSRILQRVWGEIKCPSIRPIKNGSHNKFE